MKKFMKNTVKNIIVTVGIILVIIGLLMFFGILSGGSIGGAITSYLGGLVSGSGSSIQKKDPVVEIAETLDNKIKEHYKEISISTDKINALQSYKEERVTEGKELSELAQRGKELLNK